MEDQNKPVIDVIIPAYRPDDSFQKLIGLLQEQTVKPHHIYVLQTMGEGDELMQPMNSDMTVHSVAKKDFDHGATRDYGARLAAEGNQAASDRHYILFMTQDAVPANTHLIETLAKAFEGDRLCQTACERGCGCGGGADKSPQLSAAGSDQAQGGSGAPWYQDIFLFGCLCDVSS